MVGSGDPLAAPKLAEVLRLLGDERAFVVHGDGVDEIPLDGSGVVYDVTPGGVERRTVDPRTLGLVPVPTSELAGGDPEENARLVEGVLAGELGPRRDVVLLNAGATFVVAGRAADIADGIELARATIDTGAAAGLLERLRAEKRAVDAARETGARV
jgi:anthranilate phosphoribosyltransferase